MIKIKTSEATGIALNWLVAKGEGLEMAPNGLLLTIGARSGVPKTGVCFWEPSTNWNQGGPIIEREKISIRQWVNVPIVHAYMPEGEWSSDGDSPLIAAMRCFVASKLGDEVDVPEELCGKNIT